MVTTPCFVEQVPPVCLAAAAGNMDVVELLLGKGSLLVEKDKAKRTALHYAAARGAQVPGFDA